MRAPAEYQDKNVHTRAGQKPVLVGRTTGTARQCQLEGCRGLRIGVRWPDGHITWPCSKGLEDTADGFRIL